MQESNALKQRGGTRPGAGRPRRPPTLAGAMRASFPPERIVEMAKQLAESATSEQVRLSALQLIAERAHGKVSDKLEVGAPGSMDDDDDDLADLLTTAELDALDELDEQKAKILDRVRRPILDVASDDVVD